MSTETWYSLRTYGGWDGLGMSGPYRQSPAHFTAIIWQDVKKKEQKLLLS